MNKHGYSGISYNHIRKRYRGKISVNGKMKYTRFCKTIEKAVEKRNDLIIRWNVEDRYELASI